MELVGPAMACELGSYLVNALGDDQRGSFDGLCQEIPHWPVEAAREQNTLAVLHYQCKGAIDCQNCIDITSEQPAPSLRFVGLPEAL